MKIRAKSDENKTGSASSGAKGKREFALPLPPGLPYPLTEKVVRNLVPRTMVAFEREATWTAIRI